MTEAELKRQSVLCRREADGVAVVTIDRPERRNALNLEVKRRIADEIAIFAARRRGARYCAHRLWGLLRAGSDIARWRR